MIEDNTCEDCGGTLNLVPADPPWTIEHFQCSICDGTFNVIYDIVFEQEF